MTRNSHRDFALLILAVAFAGCASTSRRSPQREAAREAVHRYTRFELYPVVTLQDWNGDALNLVLDSGADKLVLTQDCLHSLHKMQRIRETRIQTIYGLLDSSVYQVPTLTWDALKLDRMEVLTVDRAKHEFLSRSALDGLLGLDHLGNRNISIDCLRKAIRIDSQELDLRGSSPLSFKRERGKLYVEGRVGSAEGFFLVDTGSPYVEVTPAFCESVGLRPDGQRGTLPLVTLPGVILGNANSGEIRAVVREGRAGVKGEIGTLGFQLITRLGGIMIDWESSRLWFAHRSPSEGVEHTLMAARSGLSWAQFAISDYLEGGVRIPGEDGRGLHWLKSAARNGWPEALQELGERHYFGVDGVVQDDVAAFDCFRQASQDGIADAFWYLGTMLRDGRGCEKNERKAIEYLGAAAGRGNLEAVAALGLAYVDDKGDAERIREGVRLLTRAAERGLEAAQNNLAICFLRAKGVSRDPSVALAWYLRASAKGSVPAQYNIGEFYEKGEEGPPDLKKAEDWYRKAADQGYENAKKALERLRKTQERGFQ